MRVLTLGSIVLLPLLALGCYVQRTVSHPFFTDQGFYTDDSSSIESQVDLLPVQANSKLVLKKNYDLKGRSYKLPEGVCIVAGNGVIMNGTLYGDNTKIVGNKAVFQNVKIKGSWDVASISTAFFKDLNYDNSLQDVLALSNSDVNNTITVTEGNYYVTATSFGPALSVPSKTRLIIKGNIRLRPNDYRGCFVLNVKDAEDVIIEGGGTIEGDRAVHTGNSGEWGHGINVINSHNVVIKGMTVTNCWGDCIYIGDNSSSIALVGCLLSKGRRQGVSITSGINISVKDCTISEVQGTRPQYAIDIEPNKGESLDNVVIEDVQAFNCFGGFKSWGGAEGANIGAVTIRKCSVKGASADNPVKFVYGDSVVVEDCFFSTDDKPGVYFDLIKHVTVRHNIIQSSNQSAVLVKRAETKVLENNSIR